MEVYGTSVMKVTIDPLYVLENLNIISPGDWIIEKDGKYIQMTEESAGQHSFERRVQEVSKEVFKAYEAQLLLISYLRSKQKNGK